MSSITAAFADFVSELRFDALPVAVREACKTSVLDTLGVALAGSNAPGMDAVLNWCSASDGNAQSTLIGHGLQFPLESAALFNGAAASALDYDSYDAGKGYLHTDIVVVPAALAVAEAVEADGAALVTAIVAGTEIATRIAHTIGERKGWYLTSVLGPLGAAAAAGKLMGLSPSELQHALGIAYAHSAGTHQSIIEQGLTKRLHAGLAARAGATSAILAKHGITAATEVVEGPYGFYRMYQEGDPTGIYDGLGKNFSLARKIFKKYPTCALTHAALDAAYALKQQHRIRAQDISAVVIRMTPYMERLVGGPFRPEANPQVSAQFSIRYCVASMLMRGKLGFEELETPSILDNGIRQLAERIELRTELDGEMEPAIVSVDLRGGGTVTSVPTPMPGTPEHPMSPQDLLSKFVDCAQRGHRPLAEQHAQEIARQIDALHEQPSVRRLMVLLSAS